MDSAISTGNSRFDAALGTGGLPLGRLVEVSGLMDADLTLFLSDLRSSMKPQTTAILRLASGATREGIDGLVSAAVLEKPSVLAIQSADHDGTDLLGSASVCRWLLSVAAEHHLSIVCGMPFGIRVNPGLKVVATGLASIADLRLQVQVQAQHTGAFTVRVVKNTMAKPGAEVTFG